MEHRVRVRNGLAGHFKRIQPLQFSTGTTGRVTVLSEAAGCVNRGSTWRCETKAGVSSSTPIILTNSYSKPDANDPFATIYSKSQIGIIVNISAFASVSTQDGGKLSFVLGHWSFALVSGNCGACAGRSYRPYFWMQPRRVGSGAVNGHGPNPRKKTGACAPFCYCRLNNAAVSRRVRCWSRGS